MDLKAFVEGYKAFNEEEALCQTSFLRFLEMFDASEWAVRENVIGHLTSSAWVVNPARDKVLFAFHNQYNSWAWLGGHADGDLDLLHVAQKEAREESGISNVRPVLEVPFDVNVLAVEPHYKRGVYVPSHLHFNAVYLLEAEENEALQHRPEENAGVAWLPTDTLLEKVTEDFMKPIYQRLMGKVARL